VAAAEQPAVLRWRIGPRYEPVAHTGEVARVIKKVLLGVLGLLAVLLLGAFGFAATEAAVFDSSLKKVYAVAPPLLSASTDTAVIARGKHLAESIGGCIGCHGPDLGGKPGKDMGPIGLLHVPNLTRGQGGVGSRYSDGKLARLIRDGIKADGRGVRFMPAQDMSWWPDDDVIAVISYVRSVPNVDRASGNSTVGMLGKVLDRMDKLPLDVARRIDHTVEHQRTLVPSPTAEYGQYLAKACTGCHGPSFSGGPIPGAPASMPVPANITPDTSGIKHYDEAAFMRFIATGVKPNGKKLDPFMPLQLLQNMNDTERRALFAYLASLPARPFGGR
jgi:mono/diheme cytochrome c family protein